MTDIRPGFVATPMTRGLPLPDLLTSTPEAVARRIVLAIGRGRDVCYAPFYWYFILWAIRHLPRAIFKRLKL